MKKPIIPAVLLAVGGLLLTACENETESTPITTTETITETMTETHTETVTESATESSEESSSDEEDSDQEAVILRGSGKPNVNQSPGEFKHNYDFSDVKGTGFRGLEVRGWKGSQVRFLTYKIGDPFTVSLRLQDELGPRDDCSFKYIQVFDANTRKAIDEDSWHMMREDGICPRGFIYEPNELVIDKPGDYIIWFVMQDGDNPELIFEQQVKYIDSSPAQG